MLEFHSSSSSAVNSKTAILECVDHAFNGLNGGNSTKMGARVAAEIRAKNPSINMVFAPSTGLDLAGGQMIAGIESILSALPRR